MAERHEKLIRALALVQLLAGSRAGLTIAELMDAMSCSRRTVERMLRAVGQAVQGLESLPGDGGEKRWRIRAPVPNQLVPPTADEMAELDHAALRLEAENLPGRAALLRGAARRLRALAQPRGLPGAEWDAELLLRAEGLALRPGPRPQVADSLAGALRHAILHRRLLRLRYRTGDGGEAQRLLEPCGLLYGQRPCLLAAVPGTPDATLWRLDRVVALEATDEPFEPRFDLAALTADSFGAWREPPMEVVLRFAAEAAGEAAQWRFHPSQVTEPQADGTLVVRFRAGGLDEMALHLASWGEAVEVLAPAALRDRLVALAQALLRRHAAGHGAAAARAAPMFSLQDQA